MKVVVGSMNPVKINSVRNVMGEYFGKLEVVGSEVSSGVDDQPRTDEETIRGARHRAKTVLEQFGEAEMGFGLEGGVYRQDDRLFESAWCAVLHRDGREGLGGGLRFELPLKIAERVEGGEELGPVMNDLLDRDDVKKDEGAVGVLTKGKLTRTKAYEGLVYLAIMKFVSPEWYK